MQISLQVDVRRYFATFPDGTWRVDGTMTVPGTIQTFGMLSADLLYSLEEYLRTSRAEAGLYAVGDFKVLWADGKVEVTR